MSHRNYKKTNTIIKKLYNKNYDSSNTLVQAHITNWCIN